MTSPLFGWSLQDVVELVKVCERFYQAYGDGPEGARTIITNFKEQVDNCHQVLVLIRQELLEQDRILPSSKQKYDALETTLRKCSKVFETSEFLKAKGDTKVLKKLWATTKYVFKVEKNIKELSGILQGHIAYIQVFQQLLHRPVLHCTLLVNLSCLSRKDTNLQLRKLESHGKLLEDQGRRQTEFHQSHDQKLDAISQEISNIKLLIDRGSERRPLDTSSRAQSVIEIPSGISSTSQTAVVSPAIYEEGQKSLNEVQELLDRLSFGLEHSETTDEEKEALRSVQGELESEEIRILNSIERNQIKGVQNALQRQYARKQRLFRHDSGYYSSIGSVEYQPPSLPISRRPTESSFETNCDTLFSPTFAQVFNDGVGLQQKGSLHTTEEVCLAKVIFNNGRHKPVQFPCTIRASYDWDKLHEVFPEYSAKLPANIEVPRLLFPQNLPRPIPHVEPRGASSDDNAHLVQMKGHVKVVPAMKSLEYIFSTFKDSKKFQTLVFGKDLEPKMPINVRRIYSGRAGKHTKESEQVTLRVWRRPNSNHVARNDFSILFAVKEEGKPVKEHLEIFLHEISTLRNKPGQWLQVELDPEVRTSAGEKLNWLEFQLERKVKEENEDDRATLAKYLNPSGSPTGDWTPDNT